MLTPNIMDMCPLHPLGAMRFYRLDAEVQQTRDILVDLALDKELEYLAVAPA